MQINLQNIKDSAGYSTRALDELLTSTASSDPNRATRYARAVLTALLGGPLWQTTDPDRDGPSQEELKCDAAQQHAGGTLEPRANRQRYSVGMSYQLGRLGMRKPPLSAQRAQQALPGEAAS